MTTTQATGPETQLSDEPDVPPGMPGPQRPTGPPDTSVPTGPPGTAATRSDSLSDGLSEGPLRLSAHPFQRTGACALAVLAGRDDPADLTWDDLERTADVVVDDAVRAARSGDGEPFTMWQKALAAVFPNSPVEHNRRLTWPAEVIRAKLDAFLRRPAAPGAAGSPCAVCGTPGDQVLGKDRFPLAMAREHRNTTAPGLPGWVLCWPCLLATWAMPYGASLFAGRLVLVDTADPVLLHRLVAQAVDANLRARTAGTTPAGAGWWPARTAVTWLRRARHEPTAGARLLVFRNDNRDATLEQHRIGRERCAFVTRLDGDPQAARAFDLVGQALSPLPKRSRRATASSPAGVAPAAGTGPPAPDAPGPEGPNRLCRTLLERPAPDFLRLLRRVATRPVHRHQRLPRSAPDLLRLANRYAQEVLHVPTETHDRIRSLGGRIADVVSRKESRGDLRAFVQASARPRDLKTWLRRAAVDWLLFTGRSEPLLDPDDHELLFADGPAGYAARDLLFFAVLAALHERGWGRDLDETERADLADELDELRTPTEHEQEEYA